MEKKKAFRELSSFMVPVMISSSVMMPATAENGDVVESTNSLDNTKQTAEGHSLTPQFKFSELRGTPVSDHEVKLEWNTVTGATYYNIQRSTLTEQTFKPISVTEETYLVDSGLEFMTQYNYKLTTENSVGESVYSEVYSFIPGDRVIQFDDEHLDKALRTLANKPDGDLMWSDVYFLAMLPLQNSEVRSLNGIDKLANLSSLYLADTAVTHDVYQIATLTQLEDLDLSGTRLSTLDSLTHLGQLKTLHAHRNQVQSVGALSHLTELSELALQENEIGSIDAIGHLVKLQSLYLANNQISDISSLSSLSALTRLGLSGNSIKDIDVLSNLKELRQVDLSNNKITNIDALLSLDGLEWVSLAGNPLLPSAFHTIKALQDKGVMVQYDIPSPGAFPGDRLIEFEDKNLEKIVYSLLQKEEGEGIWWSDVYFMGSLPASKANITSFEDLKWFNSLSGLYFADNTVTNAVYLSEMNNLLDLDLSGNDLDRMDLLSKLTALQTLYLDHNNLSDLDPISNMTELTELSIVDNQFSELASLGGLTKLRTLKLDQNQIDNLTPLANLSNLVELRLSQNQIESIESLRNLQQVRKLDLSNNKIKDLSPLLNMSNLSWVSIAGNPMSDSAAEVIRELMKKGVFVQYDITSPFLYDFLENDRIIEFADKKLEKAIRNFIQKPNGELWWSDVYYLGSLNAAKQGITNLEGIELLENLTGLYLADNSVSGSVYQLGQLTHLLDLDLSGNSLQDISPLANLVELQTLYLNRNNISDIEPLNQLTSLTELALVQNNITDISSLSNLAKLRTLKLDMNKIEGLSSLGNLRELEELYLSTNEIKEINSLSSLKNIRKLDLSNNHIEDIKPLLDMESLTWVSIAGNPINDSTLEVVQQLQAKGVFVQYDILSPIEIFPDKEIQLADQKFEKVVRDLIQKPEGQLYWSDVFFLGMLPASMSQIANLEGIELFENLSSLYFADNHATPQTLEQISHLMQLHDLDLSGNHIEFVDYLEKLTKLKTLHLNRNSITDLSSLSSLTELSELSLIKNNISSIDILSNLTNLRTLRLDLNQIDDVGSLSGLSELQELGLSGNHLESIGAIANLSNLRKVDLSNNKISDISALLNLNKLKWVSVAGNPLDENSTSVIEQLKAKGVFVQYDILSPVPHLGPTLTLVGPQSAAKGSTFTVAIHISGAQELYGASLKLSFNPNLLSVVDADISTEQIEIAPGVIIHGAEIKNMVDNPAGTISFAVTKTGDVGGFSGNGDLAYITFKVADDAEGQLSLNFTENNIKLASSSNTSIPAYSKNYEGEVYKSITGSITLPDSHITRLPKDEAGKRDLGGYTVELKDGNQVVANTVTEKDGSYSFDAPTGNYTVQIKTPGYKTSVSNVEVKQELLSVTVPTLTLYAGDFNSDENINIEDISLQARQFEKTRTVENKTYDIDGDGKIDLYDIVITARNFLK
ncbi:leucine-rich repeat domain-containing protein [Ammoniphilus sp. CFH 90114]|uniref:leucine-rich repeat domain-containing protein n=1 Tax=Ammoniphilus sp. CFH 90114 TaxID=2493665 RepID=UPI00100E63B2|nr:leucine-rich repeat domain-containing protein [Ammoniphilus sp. CFH 90114]RXT08756.1 hypothetical protein EIZ39_08075 [Ammoniphilus sp. CFH 90114]